MALYTRLRGPVLLEHATRDRIYGHVRSHPGVHYRSLLRELELPNGVLVHHLRTMERERLLRTQREGTRLRFFITGQAAAFTVVPRGAPLHALQAALLRHLLDHPGAPQSRVAKALGVSRQALHYHVHGLAEQGVLRLERDGRVTRLVPATDVALRLRACARCAGAYLGPADGAPRACPHCAAGAAALLPEAPSAPVAVEGEGPGTPAEA